MVRYAADLGVPVLLHHGFLIDFKSLWHRSGVVQQLATDGLEVVLIIEHFLREALSPAQRRRPGRHCVRRYPQDGRAVPVPAGVS